MITEDYPKSTIKSHLTGSTGANKPSADTVDLTCDSDEEDEALKKALASKAKAKSNGM